MRALAGAGAFDGDGQVGGAARLAERGHVVGPAGAVEVGGDESAGLVEKEGVGADDVAAFEVRAHDAVGDGRELPVVALRALRPRPVAEGRRPFVLADRRVPLRALPALPPLREDVLAAAEEAAKQRDRRGLIERWGRGTNKIIEECERAGCPPPDFEDTGVSVVVRFRPAAHAPVEKAATRWAVADRVMEILEEAGPLGAQDLLARLGAPITVRALQKHLVKLRQDGRIVVVGRGKTTTYRFKGRRP
ncbi:MAG: hypothetical protein HY905_06845 [Deltaproteobacteria bacterium]|nr:hypothetical protein [Deltaproteobacteria bacterium]